MVSPLVSQRECFKLKYQFPSIFYFFYFDRFFCYNCGFSSGLLVFPHSPKTCLLFGRTQMALSQQDIQEHPFHDYLAFGQQLFLFNPRKQDKLTYVDYVFSLNSAQIKTFDWTGFVGPSKKQFPNLYPRLPFCPFPLPICPTPHFQL